MLEGDWRELLPPEAPFDLLFYDAAKQLRPREDGELVAGLLAPGGIAVLDDLTPGFAGPTRCASSGSAIRTWPRRRS